MPKHNEHTAGKAVERVERLRRRMLNLSSRHMTETQISEVSALEWAIPILEAHIAAEFKDVPPARIKLYKHELEATRAQLMRRDGTECYLCKEQMPPDDMTIDHVEPLSKGGRDNISNWRLVHSKCNLQKANMTLERYRQWQANRGIIV